MCATFVPFILHSIQVLARALTLLGRAPMQARQVGIRCRAGHDSDACSLCLALVLHPLLGRLLLRGRAMIILNGHCILLLLWVWVWLILHLLMLRELLRGSYDMLLPWRGHPGLLLIGCARLDMHAHGWMSWFPALLHGRAPLHSSLLHGAFAV